MAIEAFRIIETGALLRLLMWVVTSQTTYPRVPAIKTPAQYQTVGLKADRGDTTRLICGYVEGVAVAGAAKVVDEILKLKTTGVENMEMVRVPALHGGDVIAAGPVTFFAGNSGRPVRQL